MILLVHLLLGALIGKHINNLILAIILAFLSHYLLDLLPHIEYPIKNIKEKQWKKALPDFLRIILDFCIGVVLIFFFATPSTGSGQAIIYICAFFAILPDGLTVLGFLFPNKILDFHGYFHRKKIHFLRDKKISKFWRIFTQVTVAVICLVFLKF